MKVENANYLREVAIDVARMARSEHPMLECRYQNLVEQGIKTPCYTAMLVRGAEFDQYNKLTDEFQAEKIGFREYSRKLSTIRNTLANFNKTEHGQALNSAVMETYPKTGLKRLAIISGLSQALDERQACSVGKRIKKNLYRFLKFVNR